MNFLRATEKKHQSLVTEEKATLECKMFVSSFAYVNDIIRKQSEQVQCEFATSSRRPASIKKGKTFWFLFLRNVQTGLFNGVE